MSRSINIYNIQLSKNNRVIDTDTCMQYFKLINANLFQIYLSKCYHEVLIGVRTPLAEVHIIVTIANTCHGPDKAN